MKRAGGKGILVLLTSLTILVLSTVQSLSYDLFADTVMVEGGEKQKGTIYIKGDKYRIQRQGESEYIVLRHDLGLMWVVVPDEKAYVELPLDPGKTPKIKEKNSGEISRKYLGTETMDGRPTSKYEITVREGSKTESFYQWTATDLDFPVRTTSLEGAWVVEFKNIKTGVPDSVFEIPEGFDKATTAPRQPARERLLPQERTWTRPSSLKRPSNGRTPLFVP
jgi:hypothetical protein